ncbi:recombinase [Dolosigranulum pigrum]|uniref:ERF family protein n=1 Tax=Dolosigranulum pigrum TaxID=29394 RepID=UPI001AD89962|nr:ERF family protein [Dolosigranulum pigrum]QTJ50508.1 recombinase [Dolosigranulum pigrum]
MSEQTLIQKLLSVQEKLKAPKSQNNNFGKYKYRSCEDILEAVKPLNVEAGLLLTISDEIELVDGRHYVKVTCRVTDGTDEIVVTASAREAGNKKGMDDAQVTGATSSYARKYALNGLYLIDDTKDADTDEYAQQQKRGSQKQQKPKQSDQQNEFQENRKVTNDIMKKIAEETGKSIQEVGSYLIHRANEKLGRKDKALTPANIKIVYREAKNMLGQHDGN